jgi:hypothetical protein
MIKECPICKRTYADASVTFCLADGSLLSAPFDPEATQHLPVSLNTEPQATLVVPPPKANSPLRAQNALEAANIPPTIASSAQNVESTGLAALTRRRGIMLSIGLGIFFALAAVYTQSITPVLPALVMFGIALLVAVINRPKETR